MPIADYDGLETAQHYGSHHSSADDQIELTTSYRFNLQIFKRVIKHITPKSLTIEPANLARYSVY